MILSLFTELKKEKADLKEQDQATQRQKKQGVGVGLQGRDSQRFRLGAQVPLECRLYLI